MPNTSEINKALLDAIAEGRRQRTDRRVENVPVEVERRKINRRQLERRSGERRKDIIDRRHGERRTIGAIEKSIAEEESIKLIEKYQREIERSKNVSYVVIFTMCLFCLSVIGLFLTNEKMLNNLLTFFENLL